MNLSGILQKRYLIQAMLLSITLLLLCMTMISPAYSAKKFSVYQLKSGLIYRFISFTEWPETAFADVEDKFTIGILGKDPFGKAFKPVEGRLINGRKLVIKKYGPGSYEESLVKCQILFISVSERDKIEEILGSLDGRPVLTVSEFKGFLEKGGMINFVEKDNKIRFELNNIKVKQSGIKIRSMMKRLAIRIIGGPNGLD